MWRISCSNSIIRWQDYRVAASGLAESNFRHTQGIVARSGIQLAVFLADRGIGMLPGAPVPILI
jgi:hypothetical protein